nr:multidrug resistance-associated protein 4-like [Leptinotarsa decemlineata]
MALGMFTTRLALFATLLIISLSGKELTASTVFQLMSYFNILSQTLTGIFVRGITEVSELVISVRRLQNFLDNEEYDYEKLQNFGNSHSIENKEVILLKNVYSRWNTSKSDTVLNDITMKVQKGKLIAVVGPVGSGKSSLLQTLLGELDVTSGLLNIDGRFSYASQEPWVFASTIRQNIVFGAEYDKKRYKEVIRVCALESDLNQFPNKDLTIVGDKGASLSGGQKARINLARAVYRDLDIYLLDDPLSAVDIHVSKTLYEDCINGFLADKTRILITHQVHYLKNADHIIILNNGRIENEGTFNDLMDTDNSYAKLFTAEPDKKLEEEKQDDVDEWTPRKSFRKRTVSVVSCLSAKSLMESVHDDLQEEIESDDEEEEIKVKDMQEESSKGKVSGSLLLKYLSSGANCCNVSIVIFLYFFAQIFGSGTDWFISTWTNIEEYRTATQLNASVEITNNSPQRPLFAELSTNTCLYIYGALLTCLLLAQMFRSFSFYTLAMVCSRRLHKFIFEGIINATMRFFDTNPSGRILNRVSKDIGGIDEMLPRTLLDVGQMFLQMAGSLVLVIIVSPYTLVLVLVLGVFFGYLRNIYLKSSKNIKRLESIMRSPAFTQLNATLQGLTTIRAFKAEELLKKDFDQSQDYHSSAWFMSITTGTAFGFVLDMCCSLFVAIVTFSFVGLSDVLGLSGGSVGLAITQSTQLSFMVQFAMRMSAAITTQLMSVERILEYKALTPDYQPEHPKSPPKGWPFKGEIVFDDTSMSYFEGGPKILKNLNFTVKPTEKVGIVGRTGAGKSSLISALFRLVKIEGRIVIDGVDTNDLSLEDLRSKITIIPQDPVLFSGTLRYNLDPFDEFTDEQLYKAINEVELKDPQNIINRLENKVMDRGSNYSVGQRQLICLARAIIRNNKILMLDEATANVDPQTDALIQKTIRTKFANCTVLTVAHRLNTIMDSDKVLVMEAGQVMEFDHPHILLQNREGIFHNMVADTGSSDAEHLRRIARDTYSKTIKLTE